MKRALILTMVFVLIMGLMIGCQPKGNDGTGPQTGNQGTEGKFQDGEFKAESEPDERGWKSAIEITVEDGKIVTVDYDEYNEEGERKSEDETYGESMKGVSGVSPAEAYEELENALIETQNVDSVDTVAGATTTSDLFKSLAKEALKQK